MRIRRPRGELQVIGHYAGGLYAKQEPVGPRISYFIGLLAGLERLQERLAKDRLHEEHPTRKVPISAIGPQSSYFAVSAG